MARNILKFLKHLFITDDFRINGHHWYYRISEGEYEWAASLTAAPVHGETFHHPYNPFAIYAYKVRDPETGWEGYVLSFYPKGCGESACAEYILTEATDEDLPAWMEALAELAPLYYSDPEEFYHEIEESDMHVVTSDDEMEHYEFIHPTPELARKLVEFVRRKRFVNVRHLPLARTR